MGDYLSNKILTTPIDGELSNTASDMHEAYKWEIGDSEPMGTHVQNNLPLRRYRNDMRIGKTEARSYNKNFIIVDTMKPIGPQLAELK